MRLALRVILDTNVVVRAMLNIRSPSGMIFKACESRKIIPLLSRQILLEYHQTLSTLARSGNYPQLERAESKSAFERITYLGEIFDPVHIRFPFPRDSRDAKFIELAIAGHASHLITKDADLRDLRTGHDAAAKRFRRRLPRIEVMTADQFVDRYKEILSEG